MGILYCNHVFTIITKLYDVIWPEIWYNLPLVDRYLRWPFFIHLFCSLRYVDINVDIYSASAVVLQYTSIYPIHLTFWQTNSVLWKITIFNR